MEQVAWSWDLMMIVSRLAYSSQIRSHDQYKSKYGPRNATTDATQARRLG